MLRSPSATAEAPLDMHASLRGWLQLPCDAHLQLCKLRRAQGALAGSTVSMAESESNTDAQMDIDSLALGMRGRRCFVG